MLPHPVVKDVGEDSQEDEDEVFHRAAGAEDEVFHGEDAGTEDEVEVLSSSCCTKGFHQKRKSVSAQNSSSSQSSTAVEKGDTVDAGSISSSKPTRRRSKAVIEAEDDDDEAQPVVNLSRTHSHSDVDTLISKIADGADTPSPTVPIPATSDVKDMHPSQEEPLETIFTNSHLLTCSPANSCLSASAQEFQPRVQNDTWRASDMQQQPSPDLLAMRCHEASSCLPYQYHAPLPSTLQPLYQSVYQADSQPYYSMQGTETVFDTLNPLLPLHPRSRLANTWSSGQMAVALASTAMASARNEQEDSVQGLPGFVDQLTEFQQGSFFTQQECSLEHQGFAGNGIVVDDRASCYPPCQAEVLEEESKSRDCHALLKIATKCRQYA